MAALPYWVMSFGDMSPVGDGGHGYGLLIYLVPGYWSGYGVDDVYPTCAIGNYVGTEPLEYVYTKPEPLVYAYPVQFRTSQLNPYAWEWCPWLHVAPEEDRCLFLTFSKGHPITEYQIAKFFNHKYGDCLERVYVHWPKSEDNDGGVKKETPQFGKVMFKGCAIPLTITNCGKKESKFNVDGRPLWCKMFDPNKAQSYRWRTRRRCIF